MDGAADGWHLHGRSHILKQIVIASAARDIDPPLRRAGFDLKNEARIIFKLAPEARRKPEGPQIETQFRHFGSAPREIIRGALEAVPALDPRNRIGHA